MMLNTELNGLNYPFLYSIDASTQLERILSYNIEIGLNTPIARKAILWKQRIEENLVSVVNNSRNIRISIPHKYTMGDNLGVVCYHIEIDQSLNRIVIIDSFLFILPWRKEDGYPIVDPNAPPKGIKLGKGNVIVPNYFFRGLYVVRCGTKGLRLCDSNMNSLYRVYFLTISTPSCGWAKCSFIQRGRTWYNYLNKNGDLFQEECFASATNFDPSMQTAIVIWGGGKYEIRPNGIISQITENKQHNTMDNTKKRIRLTESQLYKLIKESVKRVLTEVRYSKYNHSKNPLLSREEAEYWDNLEFPDDETYSQILSMTKNMDYSQLYDKLGHDKFCAFMMRLEEDDPEYYDEYYHCDPFTDLF